MKKMLTVVMVAAFALSAGIAFAASEKCTVDKVDGEKRQAENDKETGRA